MLMLIPSTEEKSRTFTHVTGSSLPPLLSSLNYIRHGLHCWAAPATCVGGGIRIQDIWNMDDTDTEGIGSLLVKLNLT